MIADASWDPWLEDMERINASLADVLDKLSNGVNSVEVLDTIKMELHSLKGLVDAAGLTHATETVVELETLAHSTSLPLSADFIELIKKLKDRVDVLIKAVRVNLDSINVKEIDSSVGFESILVKSENKFLVEIEIEGEKSLYSSRAIAIHNSIKRISTITTTRPTVDDLIMDARFDVFELELVTRENKDDLKDAVLEIPGVKSVQITDLTKKDEGLDEIEDLTLRVKLNKIRGISEGLSILTNQVDQLASEFPDLATKESYQGFYKIIEDIQSDIRDIRKVPLFQILSGLPGMVERIAGEERKVVDFNIQGRFVPIDRALANHILDPITQIVRNAVSHGIEKSAVRRKAKKSPVGNILLSASEDRDMIIIEISDDGAGIDPKVLKKKAKEFGIEVDDSNVTELIFENKFSTKEGAKDISGRGIGLYTTRKRIEQVGGKLTVRSEKGKGTVFRIELPDQDVLIKSVISRVGDFKFAISTNDVEFFQVVESFSKEQMPSIHYYGSEIPVVTLGDLIEVNLPESDSPKILLICKGSDSYFGLVVDEVLDERLVNIKPLNPMLRSLEVFDGTILDENQEPILVLKPNAIV